MQSGLLKLIEGCEVTLPASGKMQGLASTLISMNTKDILFICGGAFSGLTASKQGHEAIIKYGLMQELVGRLPIIITLDDLDEDDLVRILTEPDDSITKEYQMLFKKDGIDLLSDDDTLHEIARLAFENGTGARGLRTILEDVLMDIMYELPDMENITECRITKDTITTKIPMLIESKAASELCSNSA